MVDRELYLPLSSNSEPDRYRAAGVGRQRAFATMPELAARVIGRFLIAGRAPWLAGDEASRTICNTAVTFRYYKAPAAPEEAACGWRTA